MIAPNTKIYVLKGIPVDKSYNHTIYWNDVESQTSYFMSKAKVTFNDTTYQRAGLGVIRVGVNADTLYDCNYLMFQNTNYSGKWFYAFIDEVEYVNDNCCNIHYTIDEMQTWFFNHLTYPCMVEREHSVTDVFGDNLVAEDLPISEYINELIDRTWYSAEFVVVLISSDMSSSFAYEKIISGVFTGLKMARFSISNPMEMSALVNYLDELSTNNKVDTVVALYMFPSTFAQYSATPVLDTKTIKTQQKTIGNYTPKNKKLFSYPYNFLYVSKPDGIGQVLKYEYFQPTKVGREELDIDFYIRSAFMSTMCIQIEPRFYTGLGATDVNFKDTLSLDDFPQCAFNVDTFKVWWAQNGIKETTNIVGGLFTAGAGAFVGGVGGASAVVSGLNSIGSSITNIVQSSVLPTVAKGNQTGNIACANRLQDFYFYNKHITEEYAKIVDDYFDKYGYATHQLKVPNRNSRPHWNYVKTNECLLYGEMPSESIEKLQNIYNKGITFWKNANEVGHYELDNRPVTE